MRLARLLLALALGAAPLAVAAEGAGPRQAENATAPSRAGLAELVALIDARLALMPEVARHKWNSGSPIADPERERRIVDDFKARAAALGLAPEFAGRFLEAQIEAAKLIQAEHFAAWRQAGAGPFAKVPDLAQEIRPRLDALTPKLLQALADNRQRLGPSLSRRDLGVLAAEKLSPAAVDTALAPLLQGGGP